MYIIVWSNSGPYSYMPVGCTCSDWLFQYSCGPSMSKTIFRLHISISGENMTTPITWCLNWSKLEQTVGWLDCTCIVIHMYSTVVAQMIFDLLQVTLLEFCSVIHVSGLSVYASLSTRGVTACPNAWKLEGCCSHVLCWPSGEGIEPGIERNRNRKSEITRRAGKGPQ